MADQTSERPTPGYERFPEGVASGPHAPETFTRSATPLLAGRRALVTGGALGVGRGIALELAREGAEIAIHYYNEQEAAEDTQRLIEGSGGRAYLFSADFSSAIEPRQPLAAAVHQALGGIDILVNNAGVTANVPFREVMPEFFDHLMTVNLRSMYFLTQAVSKTMCEQGGGVIINLCSLHAAYAMNEHSVYAMTKAAVQAFTRNVALELAPHNIRVNAITPGWCFGENHHQVLGGGSRQHDAAAIPAGYISTPYTIGRLAVHLCCPDFDYFVGQTLTCDGGMSAAMPLSGPFDAPQQTRWGLRYVPEAKLRMPEES